MIRRGYLRKTGVSLFVILSGCTSQGTDKTENENEDGENNSTSRGGSPTNQTTPKETALNRYSSAKHKNDEAYKEIGLIILDGEIRTGYNGEPSTKSSSVMKSFYSSDYYVASNDFNDIVDLCKIAEEECEDLLDYIERSDPTGGDLIAENTEKILQSASHKVDAANHFIDMCEVVIEEDFNDDDDEGREERVNKHLNKGIEDLKKGGQHIGLERSAIEERIKYEQS